MSVLTSVQLADFERLVDVGNILERKADQEMREFGGVTNVQYEILIRLRNTGGEMRMAELANSLTATPSGLTYQVRQLEKMGFVIRASVPGDDRGVLAQVTEAGRAFIRAQAVRRAHFILDNVCAPLTEDELVTLHELLGKLQVHLRGVATGGILPEMAEALRTDLSRVAAAATA